MDLPLPGQREVNSEWGDDLLDLEGAMIFVVQFPRGAACFDIAAIKHYQVSYLVCQGFLSRRIGVLVHLLLRFFQSFLGFVVHSMHPVGVGFAGWVERPHRRRIPGCREEAIVGVEWGHTITCGG